MSNLIQANIQAMTSKEIAELTGKRHADVIRDIRTMLTDLYSLDDGADLRHDKIQGVTVELDERNYVKVIGLDKTHTLTLVSGYNVVLRKKIIDRWAELEESNKPKTAMEMMMYQTQVLHQHAIFMVEQERINSQTDERLKQIEAKQEVIDRSVNEFTVLAYFVYAKLGDLSIKEANRIGRMISAYCKANGYPIGKQLDPRFGLVNSYPEHAIVHILKQHGLLPE